MTVKAIKAFTDLHDNHVYAPGDKFPWDGREISEERQEELSTGNNKLGYPVIERKQSNANRNMPRNKKLLRNE